MPSNVSSGDTAWVLISTALVFLMIPGLALFYGGLVRTKNVLSTFMHSFVAVGLITLQWVSFGYSLAFGADHHGVIGGFGHVLLHGVGLEARTGTAIPNVVFASFQLMFAIITPALISGAFAERLKGSAFILFTLLWATLVYDPLAHWVWAEGGWLAKLGALDFAGGTVVHVSSGVSALVFAVMLGRRRGYPRERHLPHNLTMTLLGAGILWFGWFGFNAGSALSAGGLAGLALINTQIAAAAGAMVWLMVDMVRHGKMSALGFASGLLAGLVAITPAAGYVGPGASIAMGAMAAGVCYGAVVLKERLGYDDTLDAFGIHGVGGILGSILTGVFARKSWNAAGADGLLAGNPGFLAKQALATGVAAGYAAVATFVIVKVVAKVVGLRVSEEVEFDGLDTHVHGEQGYALGATGQGHLVATPHERRAPAAEEADASVALQGAGT